MHILRAPETTTSEERDQIARLDKYQKKYLAARCCALCDHGLDRVGCGSFYEACPESARIARREKCLGDYKPRISTRKHGIK